MDRKSCKRYRTSKKILASSLNSVFADIKTCPSNLGPIGNVGAAFGADSCDYIWRQNKQVEQGKFRPLKTPGEA